ncbi:uncharacterized protein DS421_20g709160 [Arachis hypogaea]|nr:uncharacterized protein DS421_20g709160 [Arachis hypogaea]
MLSYFEIYTYAYICIYTPTSLNFTGCIRSSIFCIFVFWYSTLCIYSCLTLVFSPILHFRV